MKKITALFLALSLMLTLASCGCKHEWAEATCTAPKTCTLCGETEGDLEHLYGEPFPAYNTLWGTLDNCEQCTLCNEVNVISSEYCDFWIREANSTFLSDPRAFAQRLNLYLADYGWSAELLTAEDGTFGLSVFEQENDVEPVAGLYFMNTSFAYVNANDSHQEFWAIQGGLWTENSLPFHKAMYKTLHPAYVNNDSLVNADGTDNEEAIETEVEQFVQDSMVQESDITSPILYIHDYASEVLSIFITT